MRLLRIVNGQMKECWAVFDMLGWMQQLGAISPRPGLQAARRLSTDTNGGFPERPDPLPACMSSSTML